MLPSPRIWYANSPSSSLVRASPRLPSGLGGSQLWRTLVRKRPLTPAVGEGRIERDAGCEPPDHDLGVGGDPQPTGRRGRHQQLGAADLVLGADPRDRERVHAAVGGDAGRSGHPPGRRGGRPSAHPSRPRSASRAPEMARPLTAAIADGCSAVTDIGNRKPDGACLHDRPAARDADHADRDRCGRPCRRHPASRAAASAAVQVRGVELTDVGDGDDVAEHLDRGRPRARRRWTVDRSTVPRGDRDHGRQWPTRRRSTRTTARRLEAGGGAGDDATARGLQARSHRRDVQGSGYRRAIVDQGTDAGADAAEVETPHVETPDIEPDVGRPTARRRAAVSRPSGLGDSHRWPSSATRAPSRIRTASTARTRSARSATDGGHSSRAPRPTTRSMSPAG